ncbi:MAG: phage tail sheath subtilisin-like domain-containing protein [Burkholderiales bacterium]|nr:phage tail sheath subtilisin-like domain-containing protein [Burkholderiales bacterium]
MASYLHPGVYIEEVPSGARAIEGVGTSTACFVGHVLQGPVATPVLITNFSDYERVFGGLREDRSSSLGDAMGHAVSAFFLNGGSRAYVVRAVRRDSARLATALLRDVANTTDLLRLQAANPGVWADGLVVRFTRKGTGAGSVFLTEVGREAEDKFVPQENLGELVPEQGSAYNLVEVVNTTSRLVRAQLIGPPGEVRTRLNAEPVTSVSLTNGDDGDPPQVEDYRQIFAALLKVRDINILLLPGRAWTNDDKPIVEAAIAHCETIRNRMLIIDPPPGDELTDEADLNALDLPTSTYTVMYYPWVHTANPFYNPDTNPAAPRTVRLSPAALVAGLWAKTDARRGVWKAPAGIEFPLLGVAAPEFIVEDAEQDFLNPAGINAIRRMPGYGPVVWGTRTRSTRANPEWRYVPVRRTAIFIEESIYNGIQWAVFEPNDHRLWSSLRTSIESFMNGLFRAGAFQGEKASDAYFVRCGLGQTMTQDDIDRGMVIVLVGFAPLKPAEFVIVRIQQKVAQQ